MSGRYDSILGTIGRTPVVRVKKLVPQGVNVFVLDFGRRNDGASADRILRDGSLAAPASLEQIGVPDMATDQDYCLSSADPWLGGERAATVIGSKRYLFDRGTCLSVWNPCASSAKPAKRIFKKGFAVRMEPLAASHNDAVGNFSSAPCRAPSAAVRG
jgi:hypothetical protein